MHSAPTCTAFQISASDNVATLLGEAVAGSAVAIAGPVREKALAAREKIGMGHKIALRRIDGGEPIVKYGVTIGIAIKQIEPGDWVHLHNCRSQVDERSGSLDLHTGVPKGAANE
jgi:altronate hydrolase/altronate dehydratase small subunit